jgi:hypothetical protein
MRSPFITMFRMSLDDQTASTLTSPLLALRAIVSRGAASAISLGRKPKGKNHK